MIPVEGMDDNDPGLVIAHHIQSDEERREALVALEADLAELERTDPDVRRAAENYDRAVRALRGDQ